MHNPNSTLRHRLLPLLLPLLLTALPASNASAQAIVRHKIPNSDFPIAQAVTLPPGTTIHFISGQVPPTLDKSADPNSLAAYGDTKAQTTGVLNKIRDVLKRATTSVGVEAPLLVSGAGHDAQNPALSGVPTGMIFVRSTGGSHTPREFASIEDAALGAQALANAIKELAT